MIVQFRLRRADAVEWTTVDPVLQDGEPGWEYDTNRIKIGDGVTPWSGLGYATYPATEFEQMIGDLTLDADKAEAAAVTATGAASTATSQATAAAAAAVDADSSAADAAASEAHAAELGTSNDTQTGAFVNDPASATTAALTSKYVNVNELVLNAADYGIKGDGTTQDLTALNAAITAAAGTKSVTVYWPPPSGAWYQLNQSLPNVNNVRMVADGFGTVLRWVGGSMLAPTTTLQGWSFENIGIENFTGGSHLIDLGDAAGGLIHTTFRRVEMRSRLANSSLIRKGPNNNGNCFNLHFYDCKLWRTASASVPAIDISSANSGTSDITFTGGQWHSQNANTTPFARFECTSSANYISGLAFRNILGEQNHGGMVHCYGCHSVTVENVTDYDGTAYADDLFKFDVGSGGAATNGIKFDSSGTTGAFAGAPAGKVLLRITGGAHHQIGRVRLAGTNSGPTALPASGKWVHHVGGPAWSIRTLTANFTVLVQDHHIIGNGNNITFTLPDPTAVVQSGTIPIGREYVVKNIHATPLTVVSAGTATVDGATSRLLTTGESVRFVTDGTNWLRFGPYAPRQESVLVGDGTTNQGPALNSLITAALPTGSAVRLSGNLRTTGAVTVNDRAVRLVGTPEAKLTIAHVGAGYDIKPASVSIGNVSAAAVGDTTLTITGAAFVTNEHAGKWVEVTDPVVNAASGDGTVHARRILSNTATVLTLEYAIGYPIPASTPAVVYVPLDEVVLEDLTIDRTTVGGANIVIRYAKSVRLTRVKVTNSGNYATATGNALSIYHCDKVRMDNVEVVKAGGFGCFIYNCDDVLVDGYRCNGWGGQFAIQVKDSRNALVLKPHCVADGVKGDTGVNTKCSGLNPSFNVAVLDGFAANCKTNGFEFSSITAEGSVFAAYDHQMVRCKSSKAAITGFTLISDAGAQALTVRGWVYRDCSAVDGQTGFSVPYPVLLVDCYAARNQYEGINIAGNDVVVRGGRMTDNVQAYVSGATRSSEVLIGATTTRTLIDGMTFERTTAGKSIRAVRELAGAVNTIIRNTKITHPASPGYTQDYLLSGTGSKAVGDTSVDFYGGTPPTIVKKPNFPTAVANPDTSGATLAALETEVNELKALLRTAGLLA